MKLKIYKIHPNNKLPVFATKQSACFDLSCQMNGKNSYKVYSVRNKARDRFPVDGSIFIGPGERAIVPTGLIFDIPEGHSIRIHSRSGLAIKSGLLLLNGEGIVDSDYVEECMLLLVNTSENGITIHAGDRIAQAELVKDMEYDFEEITERPGPKTNRIGGMGSTGINIPDDTIVHPTTIKRGPGRPPKILQTID